MDEHQQTSEKLKKHLSSSSLKIQDKENISPVHQTPARNFSKNLRVADLSVDNSQEKTNL